MKSYIVKSDLVYEQYEEWEKQFIQNDEINASAYHDPDSRSVSYYEDLTSFLNKRENSVENLYMNGRIILLEFVLRYLIIQMLFFI